jgi:peptide-methionine (R)-S-oxide reductase
MDKITKTDDEWRAELTDDQFRVLREHGTEPAWTGELLENKAPGMYACAACGAQLFKSGTKFDSGSGWPSFYDVVDPEAVTLITDISHGVARTEVRCAACDSHLGHVFPDGHGTPTGERYCINSVCLAFEEGDDPDAADAVLGDAGQSK